ncbi:MAG TPA: hypothetical protein VI320_30435 [Terracidiphilus sp.]
MDRTKPWIVSRRKVAAHTRLHNQRHRVQLATLVRAAGFAAGLRSETCWSAQL